MRIHRTQEGQAAGRFDQADGIHTWRPLDRVEADHLEGERALAWMVLQAERPGYGFSDPWNYETR